MKSSGMPALVVLRVQEVLEEVGLLAREGQRHADELRLGLHRAHGRDHGVVEPRVGLGREVALQVRLVQDLPVGNRVVMARLVPLPQLVGEAALRVPGEEARVVVRHLLEGRIAEVAPLGVGPGHPVGVAGYTAGLSDLNIHCGMVLKFSIDGMPLGRLQEVDGHGVDHREVPRGLAVLGRLELRDSEPRVRKPRHVADVVGPQVA